MLESEGVPQYDSTVSLLRELKEKDIPLGVISSSKNCTYILKRIGVYELLDSVVDGNSGVVNGKPDPEIFLRSASEIHTDPGRCVVFEDAVLGAQAAKAAGMYCFGIDRYGDPSRLSKADRVITDISEFSLDQ